MRLEIQIQAFDSYEIRDANIDCLGKLSQSLAINCNLLFDSDQLSSLLWSIHSDLHEPRTVAALDYLCSMTVYLQPTVHLPTDVYRNNKNLSRFEQDFNRGRLHLRLKRRNGRVKIVVSSLSLSLSPPAFPLFFLRVECVNKQCFVNINGDQPTVRGIFGGKCWN